ncbi:MAG: hypothetical protein ACI8Y3_000530 [Paraglaciecola sp.]|jgi:hypothetical protein
MQLVKSAPYILIEQGTIMMVVDNESNIEILVSEILVRYNSRALH